MKVISVVFLLSLLSCSHHKLRQEKRMPWFATYKGDSSRRTPANSKKIKNLEEFIQALLETARKKVVPIGHEEIETQFTDGETRVTRTVYLKQNQHGYFDLSWSDSRDGELTSQNFETDYSQVEENIRKSAESGRINKITKLKDGVYELKGVDGDNSCTSTFDFNGPTANSACVNSRGEITSKKEMVLRKVDLSAYENLLRETRITICSNVLHNEDGTTCETAGATRDWWAFLFEENKNSEE